MYNLTWLWAVINKQATTLSKHHFSVRATLEAVLDRNRSEFEGGNFRERGMVYAPSWQANVRKRQNGEEA